jgi:hypothetical protein
MSDNKRDEHARAVSVVLGASAKLVVIAAGPRSTRAARPSRWRTRSMGSRSSQSKLMLKARIAADAADALEERQLDELGPNPTLH